VPVLDAMVTLIGFMLFTTSFFAIVSVESPFPVASSKNMQEQIKEKPLQLTVSLREREAEVWSPFNKFPPKKLPNTPDGEPDIRGIHDALIGIKTNFPQETKIVVVPTPATTYDTLVALMDGLRLISPTDPPIFRKNLQTGIDEPVKSLFPEIIFGNLLGGGD